VRLCCTIERGLILVRHALDACVFRLRIYWLDQSGYMCSSLNCRLGLGRGHAGRRAAAQGAKLVTSAKAPTAWSFGRKCSCGFAWMCERQQRLSDRGEEMSEMKRTWEGHDHPINQVDQSLKYRIREYRLREVGWTQREWGWKGRYITHTHSAT
jgi:hypothetical protein